MSTHTLARCGGWAAVIAGIGGAAFAVALLVVPPAVPADDFSYPLSHGWFTAVQAALAVHHAALAFAVWVWWRVGLAGRNRFAAVAAWLAIVPTAALAVWELVAVSGAGLAYPSDQTAWLDTGYGVWSLWSGVGFVLLGIAVIRARVLSGGARFVVLVLGGYVFVPMLPAIFAGFVAGRLALAGWSLLFAVVGAVLIRWAAARVPAARPVRSPDSALRGS